jgi:hypothetical protein
MVGYNEHPDLERVRKLYGYASIPGKLFLCLAFTVMSLSSHKVHQDLGDLVTSRGVVLPVIALPYFFYQHFDRGEGPLL